MFPEICSRRCYPEDATVKANAEFVKAKNERATKTFADFIQLTNPFGKKEK